MLTEEQKKSGQNPAFACVYGTYENGYLQEGMSKRFYAACAAMQGLVAHYGLSYSELHAKESYKLADELIKQENAE